MRTEDRKSKPPQKSSPQPSKLLYERLYTFAQALTGRLLIDDLAKKATEICRDILRADACAIFLKDEDLPSRLVMKASSGYKHDLSGKAEYPLEKTDPAIKLGITAWIAGNGQEFVTKDRKDFWKCPEYGGGKYDKQLHGKGNEKKCQSFFGFPLKSWDRILGVLKVESFRRDFFHSEHRYGLKVIAAMITSSIQNIYAIKMMQNLFEKIGKNPSDTKSLYAEIAKVCSQLVRAEACSIFTKNDRNRIIMRGDFGHHISFVDNELEEKSYAPGEGITGQVFETGKPNRLTHYTEHKGKLYWQQFRDGKEHKCYSWYQFPIKIGNMTVGVMKVENKLDSNGFPILEGGFSESDEKILNTLANSIVPLIIAGDAKAERQRAVDALSGIGRIPMIGDVFHLDLLRQIQIIESPRHSILHNGILDFVKEVMGLLKTDFPEYINFTKKHIAIIGKHLKIKDEFFKYCESLEVFEPILFQLPRYRSHYIHQFNVFLNGYLILNMLDKKQYGQIEKKVKDKFPSPTEPVDIFKIWFITSIFHDTGYPLGKVGDWTQSFIEKVFRKEYKGISPGIVETLSILLYRKNFRRSINTLLKHLYVWLILDEEKREKLNDAINESFLVDLSENLISGLLLSKAAEEIGLDICSTSTAVSSIILDNHNLWKKLKEEGVLNNISFEVHPFAFLLVFCDNIQEYGRLKNELAGSTFDKCPPIPKTEEAKVVNQEILVDDRGVGCKLTYMKEPEQWKEKIKPLLEEIKAFWKSSRDFEFKISYKTNEGDFDNLLFLGSHDHEK